MLVSTDAFLVEDNSSLELTVLSTCVRFWTASYPLWVLEYERYYCEDYEGYEEPFSNAPRETGYSFLAEHGKHYCEYDK